jgi:type VI secretion system protein VasD
MTASNSVNRDAAGTAKPLLVHVLQIAGTGALSRASLVAIDADPRKALGPELVAAEDVTLAPGQSMAIERMADPQVHYIAVIGAYANAATSQWRAWAPVKPNVRNSYSATFDTAAVTLAGGGQ